MSRRGVGLYTVALTSCRAQALTGRAGAVPRRKARRSGLAGRSGPSRGPPVSGGVVAFHGARGLARPTQPREPDGAPKRGRVSRAGTGQRDGPTGSGWEQQHRQGPGRKRFVQLVPALDTVHDSSRKHTLNELRYEQPWSTALGSTRPSCWVLDLGPRPGSSTWVRSSSDPRSR